jgi:hypothetical protein
MNFDTKNELSEQSKEQALEQVLVLHEDIEFSYFVKVAKGLGFIKYKTYAGDNNTKPFEEVWTTQNKKNAIHYVDDPISGTQFIWVRGPQLSEILFELDGRLPTYEPNELIEMLTEADNNNDLVDALFRISVGFPKFDIKVFQIFEKYIAHPSPLIREATVQAIAYRLWPEGEELIKKVYNNDVDKNVREFAKSILDKIKVD